MCLSDCAFTLWTVRTCARDGFVKFFPRLTLVNRVPNQVFLLSLLLFCANSLYITPFQGPFLSNLSGVMTKLPLQTLPEWRSGPPDGLLLCASASHLIASFKSLQL